MFWDRWVPSPSGWFAVGHLREGATPQNHLSWFARELKELQVKDERNKGKTTFFLIGVFVGTLSNQTLEPRRNS